MNIPYSILDLSTVGTGATATQAISESVELAQIGEELGFKRHWFAEHHSMPSVATSTPELLMGHVAAATEDIRVGSGGVMLPNHVPLQVAERFHTLEALYPGRIDLGIGRAPGTNQETVRALRAVDASNFPGQLAELEGLSRGTLPAGHEFSSVQVMPDDVELPPIWILGSSGASARLAGQRGHGYSFATHFSQNDPRPALRAYRDSFEPSDAFDEPHVIMAVGVICAESQEHADFLAGSWDLAMLRLRQGNHTRFPSPEDAASRTYSPFEEKFIASHRRSQFIGTPDSVRDELESFVEMTDADELIVASFLHSHADRVTSLRLLADAMGVSSE